MRINLLLKTVRVVAGVLMLFFAGCYGATPGPMPNSLGKSDIIGMWESDDGSVYITFNGDGTFESSTSDNSDVTVLLTGSGEWKVLSEGSRQFGMIDLSYFLDEGVYGTALNAYRQEDELVLYHFVGDPDLGKTFELHMISAREHQEEAV